MLFNMLFEQDNVIKSFIDRVVITRGATPVSSLGGGGDNRSNFTKDYNLTSLGIQFFCNEKSILGSVQVFKF